MDDLCGIDQINTDRSFQYNYLQYTPIYGYIVLKFTHLVISIIGYTSQALGILLTHKLI